MTNAHLLGAREPYLYYDKPAGFYYENGWRLVFGGNEKEDGFLLLDGLESMGAIPRRPGFIVGYVAHCPIFYLNPGNGACYDLESLTRDRTKKFPNSGFIIDPFNYWKQDAEVWGLADRMLREFGVLSHLAFKITSWNNRVKHWDFHQLVLLGNRERTFLIHNFRIGEPQSPRLEELFPSNFVERVKTFDNGLHFFAAADRNSGN